MDITHTNQSGALHFVHVQNILTDMRNTNGQTPNGYAECSVCRKWTLMDFTGLCSVSIHLNGLVMCDKL